jgi:hypothetical protein
MSSINKKVELVANISISVASILVAALIVKNIVWQPAPRAVFSTPQNQPTVNLVGRNLSLPGVNWNDNGRTLVLALQPGCHFCTSSAPFYKQLVMRQSARPSLTLIAVLPSPVQDSKAYLDSLGVSIEDVRQSPLSSIGVSGTPTLLMVDRAGVVTGVWRGRLDHDHEAEVLAQL